MPTVLPAVTAAPGPCRPAPGACVHVGAAASAVLNSCELLRSGLFCGLVAQGRGTRVEGRLLLLDGSRESNVFVCEGAAVALQDSRCGGMAPTSEPVRPEQLRNSVRGAPPTLSAQPVLLLLLQDDALGRAPGAAGARPRQPRAADSLPTGA